MRTPMIDGKAPGQFRARCHLTKAHPITDLPHYLRREYEVKGWKKATRSVYDRKRRRDVTVECFLEPLCDGFETDDPAVYAEHMTKFHRKHQVNGEWETFSRSVRAGWRSPRLKPDGQLVKALEALSTCPTCGLVAEVDDRAPNVLWWDEHQRGCAIEVAS